jgi:hypothetical protein
MSIYWRYVYYTRRARDAHALRPARRGRGAAFEGTCALSNWRPNTETERRPPKSEVLPSPKWCNRARKNPASACARLAPRQDPSRSPRRRNAQYIFGVSSRSRSIPTDSLGVPTCAGQFVTRSEKLPTHSLPLPRDGTARPRPTARLRLRRSVVETIGRGMVNTTTARPRFSRGVVKIVKSTP